MATPELLERLGRAFEQTCRGQPMVNTRILNGATA